MNPIAIALRGKGSFNLARRVLSILKSYGVTPSRMDQALKKFMTILSQFGCSATFPITAVALERNFQVIKQYQEQGIEFAIHGYRHIDHCQLSQTEQLTQLRLAKLLFNRLGIPAQGFRGPYLRASSDTLLALRAQGLAYDSSQGLGWDVLDGHETPAYQHVLNFYGALSASSYPSLPSLEGDLVCIPYSLPDDEALVHRLSLETTAQMSDLWLAILRRSYELGELFTLGLHPERTFICEEPLTAVLSEAHRLDPPVWIARLDEIATWWRTRAIASVRVSDAADGKFRVAVSSPAGTTVLVRAAEVDAPTMSWADGYQQVKAVTFTICAPLRPWIGVSPEVSSQMTDFLRQQGYVVEISRESHRYSCYFGQVEFTTRQSRPLLTQIERANRPLLRLGRWPNGARSALAITGDIDALTLWDYGLRLFGG